MAPMLPVVKSEPCPTCRGAGRVPSTTGRKPLRCQRCDGKGVVPVKAAMH